MKQMKSIIKHSVLLLALCSGIAACTKYDTPVFLEEGDTVNENKDKGGDGEEIIPPIKRYILWINIEGAGGGDLVRNALPDDGTIKGMLPHSKYMWNGLESEHIEQDEVPSNENATACASILTGALPARHGISEDTYTSEQIFDPDYDESMRVYPGFFQYISDYDKTINTLAVTPWANLNRQLAKNASRTETTSSDEETLAVTLKSLEKEDNRITYVSFRGVLDAARAGGWHSSNAEYVTAMRTMDNYVGQLLEQINARKYVYYEDWLIIVTSNHGGKKDGTYGGNSREERNMFGIFYFPHFIKSEELTIGENETPLMEVLQFDKDFQGIVLDSISKGVDGKIKSGQIYSVDSLGGAMTVELIMAARPAENRSFIPVPANGTKDMMKGKKWVVKFAHTYGSVRAEFWTNDGTDGQRNGNFVNHYIHSFGTTFSLEDVEKYKKETEVEEKEDEWGNITPGYTKVEWYRKGTVKMQSFYDGVSKRAEVVGTVDQPLSSFKDDGNLLICGDLRWAYRYILEIRIWNKRFSEGEMNVLGNRLNIDPNSEGLISYWQFYKGDKYLKDDSLVVNQVKSVRKRIGENEWMDVPTEPLRLRKKNAQGKYTENVTSDDVKYEYVSNTMPNMIADRKRLMESTMVVPTILEWIGVSYPLETSREDKFSKLDGIIYHLNTQTNAKEWKGQFLGNYSIDLEWRDYEK